MDVKGFTEKGIEEVVGVNGSKRYIKDWNPRWLHSVNSSLPSRLSFFMSYLIFFWENCELYEIDLGFRFLDSVMLEKIWSHWLKNFRPTISQCVSQDLRRC